MNDRISSLRLFVRVARTGSFTAAGKESGLSQPSVSRIISKLEADLGAVLFVRSTHAMKLTDAGIEYLARVDPILSSLEEADHLVRGDGELRGRLRVGAATSFAVRELIPRMPAFLREHPGLHMDLVLTDSRQELIEEAIDVVFRFGALPDSTMIARKLCDTPRIIVASPSYLQRVEAPRTPADLVNHEVVLGPASAIPAGWRFEKDGKSTSVRVESQLNITVNEGTTAAAVAGLGIVSTAEIACRAELESGALVQLLEDWEMGTIETNAVLPGAGQAKASARAFADFLLRSFQGDQR